MLMDCSHVVSRCMMILLNSDQTLLVFLKPFSIAQELTHHEVLPAKVVRHHQWPPSLILPVELPH